MKCSPNWISGLTGPKGADSPLVSTIDACKQQTVLYEQHYNVYTYYAPFDYKVRLCMYLYMVCMEKMYEQQILTERRFELLIVN